MTTDPLARLRLYSWIVSWGVFGAGIVMAGLAAEAIRKIVNWRH